MFGHCMYKTDDSNEYSDVHFMFQVFFDNKSHGTSALDLRANTPIEISAAGALATTIPLITPINIADIDS